MLEENAKLREEVERLRTELDQSRLLLVSLKEDFHATGSAVSFFKCPFPLLLTAS